MSNEELKPCPFCGADAEIKYSEWTDSGEPPERHHVWSVGCSIKATRTDCCMGRLAMNRGWKSRDDAIAAWNRRADA